MTKLLARSEHGTAKPGRGHTSVRVLTESCEGTAGRRQRARRHAVSHREGVLNDDAIAPPNQHYLANRIQAYGPNGLGILTVAGVPGFVELRQRLLTLSQDFAVGLPLHENLVRFSEACATSVCLPLVSQFAFLYMCQYNISSGGQALFSQDSISLPLILNKSTTSRQSMHAH